MAEEDDGDDDDVVVAVLLASVDNSVCVSLWDVCCHANVVSCVVLVIFDV